MRIACIVEGHGDAAALPLLIRRLVPDHLQGRVTITRPIRIPRGRLIKQNELSRAVELAGRSTAPGDGILIAIDADEDCPAELGPSLLRIATAQRADRRLAVVLAKREFEAWFVAAAESLVGHRGIEDMPPRPTDPEDIQDPKAWLSAAMAGSHRYRETLDQPALAAIFDVEQAATRSPSLARLQRILHEWVAALPP